MDAVTRESVRRARVASEQERLIDIARLRHELAEEGDVVSARLLDFAVVHGYPEVRRRLKTLGPLFGLEV